MRALAIALSIFVVPQLLAQQPAQDDTKPVEVEKTSIEPVRTSTR